MTILQRIRDLLDEAGIDYRHVQHGPTRTSAESAEARGESIQIGGKALLIKTGEEFRLFVLSAALRVDNNAIRNHFQIRQTRFATADELADLTGLVPGSVPPFGKPILPFNLYVDSSITKNEKIAFNAGSLTDSIIMAVKDYLPMAKPEIFEFSK